MRPSDQEKAAAWQAVAKLCEQANAILVDAEEGYVEQAQLTRIEDKARVQVGLWS